MVLRTAFQLTVKSLIYFVIACLLITILPGIPPYHVQFEEFPVTPAVKREGKFALNLVLDKAEIVIKTGDGGGLELIGPESVAIATDGTVYTGVEKGNIIQYKNGKTSILSPPPKPCERWTPMVCGRPLGLRIHNGALVVVDAYHGIYTVDLKTGERTSLFPIDQPIDGKLALFPDDLDVSKNGVIYWSDASTKGDYLDAAHEMLGGPSGRLIRFDPKTKENKVLIDGIHFSNGVQLSKNEDFVLVAELIRARVLRYYLNGPKAGQTDVFIDGLPGLPDNIRSNDKGGFLIAMTVKRDLLESLRTWPSVRKLICRFRQLLLLALTPFDYILPENSCLGQARLFISHLGTVPPEPAQIVEVDENGTILRYFDSQKPHVSLISQMSLSKEYAYLASPMAEQLLRIKRSDLE